VLPLRRLHCVALLLFGSWFSVAIAAEAHAAAPRTPRFARRASALEVVTRDLERKGLAASKPGAVPAGDPGPVIAVTKTDTLVTDVDNDTKVDPGDTIEYRIRITNQGGPDAAGVQLSDTIDPSTTLSGSANVSPLAFDDAYTAIGNTVLEVGVPAGPAPAVRLTGSVLANDVEFLGDTFTLSAFDATSTNGGTVAMNPDGSFTYLPAAGFAGSDDFTYTIADGGGLTSTGKVTIAVNQRVWYVNNAAAPGGDGRSNAPFDALTPVNGVGGAGDADSPGDIVFLYQGSGAYTTGIELENNQSLIGEGVALVVDPGTGPVTLVAAGSPPTLTRTGGTAVLLASGNTVRGLNVTSSGGAGVVGTAAGTLTMNSLTIATTGGMALQIQGGALAVTLASVTDVNPAGGGVLLQNNTGSIAFQALTITNTGGTGFLASNSGTLSLTGASNSVTTTTGTALSVTNTTIAAGGLTFQTLSSSAGANGIVLASTGALGGLTVTGTGAANSGGIITSAVGDGISLSGVRSASFTDFQITGSGSNHVEAASMTNGLLILRLTASTSGSDGVRLINVLGPTSITSSTVSASAGLNLHVQNSSATVASPGAPDIVTIAGSTFTNTIASLSGSSGVRFEGLTGANMRLVLGTSTVTNNRIDGLEVKAQNNSRVDIRVSGTTFTGNLGSAINVSSTNTATAIADVRNLTGVSSGLNVVNFIGFDTSLINATVDNVQITGSTSGAGIRAIQEGNGTVVARLINNNISGIAQDNGILTQARAGTGLLSLNVANNTVNNTASGVLVLEGMYFESGSSAGGDANTLCLNLANNSSAVSAISAQEGYRLRVRPGATFNLQNFAGNGTSTADVMTWVNTTKSNVGTSQITIGAGATFSNAPADCPTPPALPAVSAAELDAVAAAPATEASPLAQSAGSIETTRASSPFASLEPSVGPVIASATLGADVSIPIGTLPAGKSVLVVFRVAINSVIAGGAKLVSNQASVSGDNFVTVLSDDPDAPGAADPTVTIIDDTLLPQVTVVMPNGGETWALGAMVKIAWTADDNQGVTAVDVRLTRDLGTTWEDLATGIANSGTFTWTVTPPPTNVDATHVFTALIEVRAHDANGNLGSDQSDAPFEIFDVALETLLSLFEANPLPNAIELRWSIASDQVTVSGIERATEAAGPWTSVAATMRNEGHATVLLDATVQPGRTYWYRIAARGPEGQPLTFGPLRVTAGVALEFALNFVGPNPSAGSIRIDLSLAARAPIRVSVIDLQGREVAVLLDGVREAGRYQAVWSGTTSRGVAPAGMYFVRYRSPAGTFVRRVTVAR
jgi:trimeric autotransporter adhesin